MNYLVISCSLNPDSRSKILAESVRDNIKNISADVSFLDLAEEDIPFCDGAEAYSKPITKKLVDPEYPYIKEHPYNNKPEDSALKTKYFKPDSDES